MEDGRWITTKSGTRVFIKSTNDYMNNFIRNKGKIIKDDIAVHYGDLGKARDTTFFSINSSNRSTGHFGTGTYFISKEKDDELKNNTSFTRGDRPRKEINFNNYNLYKPKDDGEGIRLHEGLKAVNYAKYNDIDFKTMKLDLKRNGIEEYKINRAIDKVENLRKEYLKNNFQDKYNEQQDSMSTVFMKELGFNGIDVRGLEKLDNTGYGSVIYDLNKKKN